MNFNDLPGNLKPEAKELISYGVNDWLSLSKLSDEQIFNLVKNGKSTKRNLYRLRAMAVLISEIDLPQAEAALLIHSGISTARAISALTPQELFQKTGRLERNLKTGRKPLIGLQRAGELIRRSKSSQMQN